MDSEDYKMFYFDVMDRLTEQQITMCKHAVMNYSEDSSVGSYIGYVVSKYLDMTQMFRDAIREDKQLVYAKIPVPIMAWIDRQADLNNMDYSDIIGSLITKIFVKDLENNYKDLDLSALSGFMI